jgi:uncharacterized membrane protein
MKSHTTSIEKRTPPQPPSKTWYQSEWLVPAGLLLLALIPALAGTFRLVELGSGADITEENARFFASPAPVVIHIISAILFAVLGAFQFVPSFRIRNSAWHRASGRLWVPLGLLAGLSGLWMTHFYDLPPLDGDLLYGLRMLFGIGMVLAIGLGYLAMRRRDFAHHGAWMTRAYAIGMGAGTQVLTHLPWVILFGTPGQFPRAILMGAGWVINLAIAEWVIYQRFTSPKRLRKAT